jgi:dTDP-4-dehydrorhamnose reductase
MRKLLITGALGQLGSELRALAPGTADYEFIFTDFDTLDITNQGQVERSFERLKPHFVINCAAYTAVDQAEKEADKARLLNVRGPGYLASACRETKARFIHISTDYVFNGLSCKPYDEFSTPDPQGVYGLSKLEGELLIQENLPEAVILRTSWLYSPYGSNFVKTMIRLGKERGSLQVVFDQTGTPTYARDLASAILEIARTDDPLQNNWQPGIYNYSNEGVCSWYDFAMEIFSITGIDCRVEPILSAAYPTPAVRPSYSVLNKAKIKSAFKLSVPYWRDSLKACIQRI